jgi:hypothetical protein
MNGMAKNMIKNIIKLSELENEMLFSVISECDQLYN